MGTDQTDIHSGSGLIERAGVSDTIALNPAGEEAWIEVIHKMDEVYADFVQTQVEVERKNAALEEAQQFIGGVLASMTDVLVACDINGRIQRVNQAFEHLTGKNEAQLVGQPLRSLLAPDSLEAVDGFQDELRSDRVIADREVSLIDRNGLSAPLAINCSARYDHEGGLAGMVLIGRPVGELRRAYEELDEAHKRLSEAQQQLVFSEKMAALGRLVAGVAHELNNPISFVFGNMHALKRYGERLTSYLGAVDEGIDREELQDLRQELKIDRILNDIGPLVDGTLEGAERVSDIVQDLLRFSSSQTEPLESYDLVKILRTASSWVAKAARDKPQLRFDVPDELVVVGRKGPIHQIIVNLVQNAVDVLEGRSGEFIEITCRSEGGSAVVRVRDNGPGIASENLPRVFEPFFTTKPIGEGTGLGLYVSYAMASEQGGTLEADNHKDGGAEMVLRVPLEYVDGD